MQIVIYKIFAVKTTLFLILSSLITTSLVAQTNSSSIFRFLDLPPDAASAALGGAHPGLFNGDYSALHLNPAYLAGSNTGDVSATFANYFADSRMGFVSTAIAIDQVQTVGLGLRYMSYGNFNTLDEDGNDLGRLNALDLALSALYAYKINENWNTGAEVSLIYSGYGSYKSSGAAISGGLYFKDYENHFSFGLAVRNLGAQFAAYNETKEPLPLDVAMGISKKPQHLPIEVSLTLRQLNNWDMRRFGETGSVSLFDNISRHFLGGAQLFLGENLTFRVGYNHYLHELNRLRENFDLAGTGIGIGLKIRDYTFDISRTSFSKSGGVFMLSVKTNFSPKRL